jgi:sugar phosphate isomerase/epimerase
MSIKMGFQLSSVTKYLDTPENLHKSFAKLAKIGYRYVQIQGIPTDIQDNFIMETLTATGLTCVATQEDYPFGFGENPDRGIARAVQCGAKYLCCALIPRDVDSLLKLEQFAIKLSEIAEKVQSAGLIFTFHPIGGDYRNLDGRPVYERLLEMLPKTTQLTFCVNAALNAGIKPITVFEKFAGRIDLVHFKDDALMPEGNRHLMPLGQGSHDWKPILRDCKEANVKYVFAEQERWLKDAFDCAKDSFEYLKTLGL